MTEVNKIENMSDVKFEESLEYLKIKDDLYAVNFSMKVKSPNQKARFFNFEDYRKEFSGFLNEKKLQKLLDGQEIPEQSDSLGWHLCDKQAIENRNFLPRSAWLENLEKSVKTASVSAKNVILNPRMSEFLYHIENVYIKTTNGTTLTVPINLFDKNPVMNNLSIHASQIADNLAKVMKASEQVKLETNKDFQTVSCGSDLAGKIYFFPTQEQFNLMTKICDEIGLGYSNANFKSIAFALDMLGLEKNNWIKRTSHEDKIKGEKQMFFVVDVYPKEFILASMQDDVYKKLSKYILESKVNDEIKSNDVSSVRNKI
jgi:hypothetical protein